MKPLALTLIAAAVYSITPAFNVAASEQEPSSPTDTKQVRQIILLKKSDKSTQHRAPAKPIYGYYDGCYLSFIFDYGETNQDITLCINSFGKTTELHLTQSELIEGVHVELAESDSIELIFADGTSYSEPNY